ncbi:MAG TPA: YdiU family protein, partial [Myxococcales bacterium]|nr:YdiU family protein [Myxococcales bacterium]
MTKHLQDLQFDNSFVRELPADPEETNVRRQVTNACFSRVAPTPVKAPSLVAISPEVAELIGISPKDVEAEEVASVMSGNQILPGMDTYAACYGGHQFGNWAGQLGDGRAITLGEVLNSKDERWELQLKGAGATPYSRMGDGRAVMRSSLREFLCSEAMHHLGVPTTRALSLVDTGEEVMRDMFYDGNSLPERGAVVCRVAPSFLRFGNFEILASRNEIQLLKTLADYAIQTHFPHLGAPSKEVYVQWLAEICKRTGSLIAHWMRVGFVHGVMNTDNMSILGLTIDYGPYGWLEGFDPMWTPNTTDAEGKRYCYGRQAQTGLWNLLQFANAIFPLVGDTELLETALRSYGESLNNQLQTDMANKLGMENKPDLNDSLVGELVQVLQLIETDMPIFYRNLADVPVNEDVDDESLLQPIMAAY